MTAAPKAISHGLGGGAGAALGAFAGTSAANAGEAAEAASAAKSDNTTFFFIESAPLFDRPEGSDRSPLPVILRTEPPNLPGCDRSGRVLTCVTRKFRPVACRRGKPKTGATAAFLGELARYRKKVSGCCVNVTIPARDPIPQLMNSHSFPQGVTGRLQPICNCASALQAAAAFLRLASRRESTSATI